MSSDTQGIFTHLFTNAPDYWEIQALPDVVDFQEGPGILAKDFHDSGVPLLRLSSISGPVTSFEGCNYLDPEKVKKKWDHFRLKEKDILLSTSGSLGRVSEVAAQQEDSICYTGIIRFRPRSDRIIYSFIKYFLQSKQFKLQADSSASGSVLSHFGPTHLKKMSFPVPPIDHQKFIERLISPIDDKIQLNHKINETLEQMAQAIFKSWFVDFEPVKAKIATLEAGGSDEDALLATMQAISGKDQTTLARLQTEHPERHTELRTTAELFPSGMQDSELGEIPVGWTVAKIADFGRVVCGKTPSKQKSDFFGDDIPFIKIPDMHGNMFAASTSDHLSHLGAASQSKKVIPKGSVCVSCIATVGRVVITTEDSHTNQQINSIVPNKDDYTAYLYFRMESLYEYLHDLASGGSATLNLNTSSFARIPILKPSEEVLTEYAKYCSAPLNRILVSMNQTNTLANLRDRLLPKLLSGELTVTDADPHFAQAANNG